MDGAESYQEKQKGSKWAFNAGRKARVCKWVAAFSKDTGKTAKLSGNLGCLPWCLLLKVHLKDSYKQQEIQQMEN